MKNYYHLISIVAICVCFLPVTAQVSSPEDLDIDPSKFFKIKELKGSKHKTLFDHGLRMENDYVDNESILYVEIDHGVLIDKLEFVGNISISAYLNDRKIRVGGYSEVGEESIAIGVNGVSSSRDFVTSFLGLLVEASELQRTTFNELLYQYRNIESYKGEDDYLKERIGQVNNLITYVNGLEMDTIDLKSILLKSDRSIYYSIDIDLTEESSLSKVSKSLSLFLLEQLKADYENKKNAKISGNKAMYNDLKPSLFRFKARLPLIVNYIAYLSSSNDETSRAFSKAIEKDPIFVSYLSDRLFKAATLFDLKYDEINKSFNENNQIAETKIDDLLLSLKEIESIVIQLVAIRDSFIINSLKSISRELKIEPQRSLIDTVKLYNSMQKEAQVNYIEFTKYFDNEELREELIEKLTTKVGRTIYKKLVPGIIDLSYEDAKEGDVLRVYVDWYNHEGDKFKNYEISTTNNQLQRSASASDKPLQYFVAKFKVKETGFRLRVADSFFLVDRIGTPSDTTSVSPSKFKGAPGVSLLWSYGDDGSHEFWNFMEPSFGINASYLDFNTEKDIEIGLGLTLGLFRNRMFFTWGKNLNVNENAGYFGIGLSFANLGNAFAKDNK